MKTVIYNLALLVLFVQIACCGYVQIDIAPGSSNSQQDQIEAFAIEVNGLSFVDDILKAEDDRDSEKENVKGDYLSFYAVSYSTPAVTGISDLRLSKSDTDYESSAYIENDSAFYYDTSSGNASDISDEVVLNDMVTVVPEPATLAVIAAGAMFIRRRR
jgi:hypothetical protein